MEKWRTATTTALSLVSLTMAVPIYCTAADWTEKFNLTGDFRYRYEYFNEEARPDRHRNRLRLRLGIHGQVNDTVEVGAVLASGGEDPISTNQTLDSQASTKDIRLDQGYFAWKPMSALTLKGGKFKNPFYMPVKTELLWDVDFRPEGLALLYDNDQVFATASYFIVEERSREDDSFLLGAQVGYKAKFGGTKMTVGTGYFNYTEVEGQEVTDFDFLDNEGGDPFGNTLDANGNFVSDYNEWELFGDVTFKAGSIPVSLFADYVVNALASEQVSDNDTGYLIGFKIGKAKAPNSWDFRYNYRKIESDAVFGTFTDSDFRGGGTDGKGHEMNFGYQIAKGWKFAFSYFMNDRGIDNGTDYDRVQIDLKFNF